jgi:O-antigen/teichoic acid export membrane protein
VSTASPQLTDVSEAPAQRRRALRLPSGNSASRITVMGIRVVSMLINFLVQIVMARVMGLAAFGSASTALAILNIVVIPAALGYDTAAIRFVALTQDDEPRLRAITVRIGATVARSCVVTAILVGVAAAVESAVGNHELAVGLAFLVAIVPGFALVRVAEAWLRGSGSVVRALINSNVLVPALSIVFLLIQRVAAGPHHEISVAGALGARAVATALSVALVVAFVLRRIDWRLSPRGEIDAAADSEMQKVAVVLCGVAFLTMAVNQIDVVAVSNLRGASAAGIYSAASRVALSMNVCIVAVAFVLAPRVARLFADGATAQLQHEVSSAAFWSGGLMAVACLILIPESAFVLHVFGSKFGSGSDALRILMLGQLANGLCGPVAVVLNMTGKQMLAIRALGVAAIVDVVALGVLIPRFGLTGAACATASCTFIWNVAMLAYVRRDLGIWVLPGFLARVLP